MINEQDIKVLERQIVPMVNKTTELVIKNPKDMEKASDMRSKLKGYAKDVKEKKESVTKPINEALKATRDLFRPLEEKLETAIDNIDQGMINYQTEQRKIADEKLQKISDRVAEGKGNLKMETAVKKMEQVEVPENKVGNTYFKPVPVFKVVDISKLPIEYMLANEVKIRQAMLAGIKLEGVEYSIEQRPNNARS